METKRRSTYRGLQEMGTKIITTVSACLKIGKHALNPCRVHAPALQFQTANHTALPILGRGTRKQTASKVLAIVTFEHILQVYIYVYLCTY